MSIEHYHEIIEQLNLGQGVPYTPEWSAAPDFIRLIVDHALRHKPETIVECSSGLTTLMLARCCQMNGVGDLYSLENGPEYAATTRRFFGRYGLDNYVTVIDAPLTTIEINGAGYQWYRTEEINELLAHQGAARKIEMLVIDGPPGFIQRHSRYPALPLLFDRLADGCTLFLDDAAREDEQQLVKSWLTQYPQCEHQYIDAERGCSILTINR